MAEHYDVIIIGAGLGGLTCGAYLAKAGRRVLLLEKNARLGGYATSYESRGHVFDIATQALGGCDPSGPVHRVLDELGLADQVSFLPCEPARAYYFGDEPHPYLQHGRRQELMAELVRSFPDQETPLNTCFDIWEKIFNELQEISVIPPAQRAFGFARRFPHLTRYGRATVQEFFDELKLPEALRTRLAARASYCLLPLDRLSLVGFACTEMSYANGAWMVQGGVRRLAEALADGFKALGGKIRTRTAVTAISPEPDASFVITSRRGKEFRGDRLVLAGGVLEGLQRWLPDSQPLPQSFLRKFNRQEVSGSYYVAYYQVPEDAVSGLPPNIEVRDPADPNGLPVYYLLIPSLVDRDSAPAGMHSLCLSVSLPPGRVPNLAERKTIRQKLEKKVEKKFPALAGRLTWLFELSPSQLAAMTGNPAGSAYGWALTPEQAGIYRLNIRTPIAGLYLAGHWTMPGGGIAGVITSGHLCAEAMLQDEAEPAPAADH